MRLAVFRAEADGQRTAARLAERGHEAVLAPVIRIVPTGVPINVEPGDVLVFTSQHAVEVMRPSDRDRVWELPCFCVGSRTAEAARAAGFADLHVGGGDGPSLAMSIAHRCPPAARIVFVAGRERKPDLETSLLRLGFEVRVAEAYAAEPSCPWSSVIAEALASCDGALHYSQRTASLACRHCRMAGLTNSLRVWTHYCLSDDVAEALERQGLRNVRVAAVPQEAALLSLL